MTLKELQQRIVSLQIKYGKNFELLQLEVVYELDDVIADLNTEQLWSGKRADESIMPEYANGRGPIRLYKTGAFYDGFFVERTGSFPIVIDSADNKRQMLAERYGEEIFGLTKQSIKELAETAIKPRLVEKIREELFV